MKVQVTTMSVDEEAKSVSTNLPYYSPNILNKPLNDPTCCNLERPISHHDLLSLHSLHYGRYFTLIEELISRTGTTHDVSRSYLGSKLGHLT